MAGFRKALLLSFLERYTSTLIGTVAVLILARILSPRDVGLYSVAAAATSLIGTLRDFGIATFLIQEKDLTEDKLRTALGLSWIASALIGGAIFLASGLLADLYCDAGVLNVLRVMAISFLFIPFSATILMCMRREMRFDVLYKMTTAGSLGNAAISVLLALLGCGYMSLAWANVAGAVATALVAFHYRPRMWRYVPTLKAWRVVLSFGVLSTLANLCSEVTQRSTDLLVGRFLGFALLGQLSRALGLIALVNQTVISAAMPVVLSIFAMKQRSGESVKGAYLDALALITGILWPIFLFIGLMAFPLIRILFGPAWDQAAPLASVLAVAALVTTLCAMHPQAYQAAGAMRERLRVQLLIAPVQITTIVTSTRISLTCVTYALMANAIVELIVSQQAINRLLGSTPADIFRSVAPSGLVAVASAIGPTAIAAWSPPQPQWLWMPVLMAAASAAVGWTLAIIITRHPLHNEIFRAIGALREWRGAVARRQGPSEISGATEAQCGVVGRQV